MKMRLGLPDDLRMADRVGQAAPGRRGHGRRRGHLMGQRRQTVAHR